MNDFATWPRSFFRSNLTQGLQRDSQSFARPVNPGRTRVGAQSDVSLIQGGAQSIAIAREVAYTLNALVRGNHNGDRVSQAATFGAKKFADVCACDAHSPISGVYRVEYQNDLHGSLAPGHGLKGRNGLRRIVIQNSKVLLLKIGDRRTGLRGDNDIKVELGGRRCSWSTLLS